MTDSETNKYAGEAEALKAYPIDCEKRKIFTEGYLAGHRKGESERSHLSQELIKERMRIVELRDNLDKTDQITLDIMRERDEARERVVELEDQVPLDFLPRQGDV
jgi:hypothetical protein